MTAQLPLRDPDTGALNFTVTAEVHVTGQTMPLVFNCRDWSSAAKFLTSAEFRKVAERIEFVTFTPNT